MQKSHNRDRDRDKAKAIMTHLHVLQLVYARLVADVDAAQHHMRTIDNHTLVCDTLFDILSNHLAIFSTDYGQQIIADHTISPTTTIHTPVSTIATIDNITIPNKYTIRVGNITYTINPSDTTTTIIATLEDIEIALQTNINYIKKYIHALQ